MRHDETWRDSAHREQFDPEDAGDFIEGRVFVGMPFDVRTEDSRTFEVIAASCRQVGLQAERADDKASSGPIPNRILRAIEEAEFIVIDLSRERPNVYYELGYAHGVGNRPSEILLIAEVGTTLHFDIANLGVMLYESAEDLGRQLPARLRRMIDESR